MLSDTVPVDSAPLVSVIIPCFNQSHYAYEAVLSAKYAYRGPLEIVVIDDGSTKSGTERCLRDVAARFADERCRIEIIRQENKGLSGARNTGLQQARGNFVQLLDCDDLICVGKIDAQILHFSVVQDLSVSVTDFYYANDDLDGFERLPGLLHNVSFSVQDFANRWERGFSLPIHCALFRRDIFFTTCSITTKRPKRIGCSGLGWLPKSTAWRFSACRAPSIACKRAACAAARKKLASSG